MKKTWIATLAISVALILVLFLIIKPFTTGNVINEELDSFAKCLTNAGLTMYGTEWCSHCKNQKELFGDSFQYINYIDCDRKSEICTLEGITGYPTWKINNQSYPGEQSFSRLSGLTGCNYNDG
jgi:glutaredoxin